MKTEKPLTENIKDKANKLYVFLKSKDDFVTKAEIGEYLGIYCERSIRDIISVLATVKPILSRSTGSGYKLAKNAQDLEEVEHTLAELSSRVEEIEKRMKPLYKFREKIKFNC